jgi:hypothetical protein
MADTYYIILVWSSGQNVKFLYFYHFVKGPMPCTC